MARVVGFMTESRGTSLCKKALIRPFVGLQSPKVSLPTVDHRRVSEGHLIPGGYFSDTLGPLSLKQNKNSPLRFVSRFFWQNNEPLLPLILISFGANKIHFPKVRMILKWTLGNI